MNPAQDLIRDFQNLVEQVPELVQPLIVLLAGAIPFIEGEVAALIGVAGGMHPIVVGIAAAAGNFLSVLLVVLLSSGARSAVSNRRALRTDKANGHSDADASGVLTDVQPRPFKPESKGRQRIKRWLVRFGVPGASILGPLAIPTQFTAGILTASGTPRGWVLLWQAVAIVIWTTLATTTVTLALTYVVGV